MVLRTFLLLLLVTRVALEPFCGPASIEGMLLGHPSESWSSSRLLESAAAGPHVRAPSNADEVPCASYKPGKGNLTTNGTAGIWLYALPEDCPLSCPVTGTLYELVSRCESGCLFCLNSGYTGQGVPWAGLGVNSPVGSWVQLGGNPESGCALGGGVGATTGSLVVITGMTARYTNVVGEFVDTTTDCGSWTLVPDYRPAPQPPSPPPLPPDCTCIRGYSGVDCRVPPPPAPPPPQEGPELYNVSVPINLTLCTGAIPVEGPTIDQCRKEYQGFPWMGSDAFFSMGSPLADAPQVWQRLLLPRGGDFIIEASAPSGSNGWAEGVCLGAVLTLRTTLPPNTTLFVMVGGPGTIYPFPLKNSDLWGGAGGTFVLLEDGTLTTR